MYLSELKKNYDAIFGLGWSCLITHQLQQHNLSCGNGPTDWLGQMTLPPLIDMINNHFKGYWDLNNIEVTGTDNGFHAVWDKANFCTSLHDFPLYKSISEAYPEFRNKMDRRIERFYTKMAASKSALFIRTNFYLYDLYYLQSLHEALSKCTSGSCDLIFVELSETAQHITDMGIEIPNVVQLQLPRGDTWMGHRPSWDELLKDIHLI